MIDTIVIRIHNINNYPLLKEQFYVPSKEKNTYTEALVHEDTGEIVENTFHHGFVYHDSERFISLRHRSSTYIASSHYNLSYLLDSTKGYLEFNFSIPKYEFGTNVLQFINLFNQDESIMYSELYKFIKDFIQLNLNEKPLLDDVEINRIDLCYNQFFLSKADALAYLAEQNKLLVKFARSSSNKFRSYDTSIMYVTRRYSFKIYHKGTEFAKNDAKELLKRNPKNYRLEELQGIADNMLRYEMTFRSSMIDYLVKHYMYSSEKQALNENIAGHQVARHFNNMVSFGQQRVAEKFFQHSKRYLMKSAWNYPLLSAEIKEESLTMTFDKTIFSILYETFWNKVKQYQVQRQVNIVEINDRISKKFDDENIKNRLRKASKQQQTQGRLRLLSTALLSHFMNVQDLKQFLPRATYQRLQRDLKEIGISEVQHDLQIPQPKLDYHDYKIFCGKFHC
ncbi:MAG: phage/plasmid replication domain-containing protein [Agriterribacter sp.]